MRKWWRAGWARLTPRTTLEAALVATGLVCVLWVAAQWMHATAFQRAEASALNDHLTRASNAGPSAGLAARSLIGRLEIPRLNMSVIVVEGDDTETLELAPGHLPDTPLPWAAGNSVIAGHRDTFFRPLKDLQLGDEIRLTSVGGAFRYRVETTRIVDPADLSALAPSPQPTLTLVTCYPFFYVGGAPKRFIVSARRTAS